MNAADRDEPGVAEGPEPEFRVVVSAAAKFTLVVPVGELDLAAAPELEAVLDLRKLSFVDASGLRVLLEAEARSRQDGMNLRFIAAQNVRRLFELAGEPDRLTYVKPPAA